MNSFLLTSLVIGPSTVAAVFSVGSLLCLLPTGLLALFMLYGGYERLKKRRLLENVPTSKVAGVTLGLNEVKGTAVGEPPLKAPLSDHNAVFYMYRVDEESKGERPDSDWTVDESADKSESIFDVMHFEGQENFEDEPGWRNLDAGKKESQFYVEDETGRIRVTPTTKKLMGLQTDKLEVDLLQFLGDPVLDHTCGPDDPMYFEKGPPDQGEKPRGKRRFREWIVPHGGEVYVLGPVRVRDDVVEAEIAADPDLAGMDHQFFLSTKAEYDLGSRYLGESRKNYGCALPLLLMTAWIFSFLTFVGEWPSILSPNIFVATGLAIAGWAMLVGLTYLKTIYDGLVELRNRVDRAWAMLEVELKRRHTLIPRLVSIVEAIAGHEQQLQEATAAARSASTPDHVDSSEQAAQAIDQQTDALGSIFALSEDYPNLKTDQHFEKLMQELSRCETKIALARRFYNDSIERLNNRIGTIPDMFIAPLARAKKKDHLSFHEFESKPVSVDLQKKEPAQQPSA